MEIETCPIRRFLLHTALFALPFLAGVIHIVSAPYPKAYAYNEVQKDCRTGTWVYERLFENPQPVDVAFIGSSITMCDVNDRAVEAVLRDSLGVPAHLANLGICRHGVNLHYLVAKDLLRKKQPKVVVVEVLQRLESVSHPDFPVLAKEIGPVIGAPLSAAYFDDVGNFTWNRWIYHRDAALGVDRQYDEFLPDSSHSFMVVPDDVVADAGDMARNHDRRRERAETPPTGFPGGTLYQIDQYAPRVWMERMADLCAAKGTRLVWLYLPYYGVAEKQPRELDYLASVAPVWMPPAEVFADATLYMDPNHLNQAGAAQLVDWLAGKIAGTLSEE